MTRRYIGDHSGSDSRRSAQRPEAPDLYRSSAQSYYSDYNDRRAYDAPELYEKPSRKKSARKSGGLLKKLLLMPAALLCVYYGTAIVLLRDINYVNISTDWADEPASGASSVALSERADVHTILIIGGDNHEAGETARSDTLMIAAVNPLKGTVKLCSILRDSYVEIPGYKKDKINAALAYGGTELCMRTVESNFRVRLRDYVLVDMESLEQIINALGGVELTITEKEAQAINSHFYTSEFSAGTRVMSGRYAVYYARIRKIDDDFHRTGRQRELIAAIIDKCKHTDPVTLAAMVSKAAPYLTSNISSPELATLMLEALPALSKDIEAMTVPVDGTWEYKSVDGASCVSMDIGENAMQVQSFLFD